LLLRRWRARYVCGMGELLRGAAGRPHAKLLLRRLRELWIYAGVLAWWAVLLTIPFWPASAAVRLLAFAAIGLAPFAAMAWRKRSVGRAVYSVASWCVNAAGLVRGSLRPRVDPRGRIESRVLHEPTPTEPRRTQPA
jgi:hypothetical protein